MGNVRHLETALGVEGAFEIIAGDGQFHGFVVVAVAAADGVDHLVAVFGPLAGEEFIFAITLDQTRHIR